MGTNPTAPSGVPASAAAAITPGVDGGQAVLKLWLLLTTNSDFLLDPAIAAAKNGATAFNPVLGPADGIQNWSQLSSALIAATDSEAAMFQPVALQQYLTGSLQTSALVLPDGSSIPYATVLTYACRVFQNMFPHFIAWSRPSPPTMWETVGGA